LLRENARLGYLPDNLTRQGELHVPRTYTKEETDHSIHVNGISIHYNEAGTGPAVICTHGGGPGANAWDNTKWALPWLAEHFRCLLVDMPGFGESQKQVSRNGVPMDLFCATLQRDLMDKLGIDKAHLYGSSAFSGAPLRFGIEFPDRAGKIVVQAFSAGAAFHETEGLKSLATFAQNPVRENMELMMRHFSPREEFRTPELVDARFKMALTPGHLESRREFSGRSNDPNLKDLLPKLKTPVLVTWGHKDGMIAVEQIWDDLERIPDVRVHVWGGNTGHFVVMEHPEEFAKLVTSFLL
jgi:4,5:9,10-diseco-3-hydroxy-5,9,17-trioxoandrosta-1(10),2-diene-4-oate hydrolase